MCVCVFFFPTQQYCNLVWHLNATLFGFLFFFCTYLSKKKWQKTHTPSCWYLPNQDTKWLKGGNRLNRTTVLSRFRVLPGIFFCVDFGGVKWWQKGCECWLSSNVKWQGEPGGRWGYGSGFMEGGSTLCGSQCKTTTLFSSLLTSTPSAGQ